MWKDKFEEELAKARPKERMTIYHIVNAMGFIGEYLANIENEDKGRGPRFLLPKGVGVTDLPVPDARFTWSPKLLGVPAFGLPRVWFGDVKAKDGCSWYRKKQRYQSGIDKRAWYRYRQTEEVLGYPVYILHLIYPTSEEALNHQQVPIHRRPAPTGLYVHPVSRPYADEYMKMVYWGIEEDMVKLATLRDVIGGGAA